MRIEATIEGETITAELSYVDWRDMCQHQPQWASVQLPAQPKPSGAIRGALIAAGLSAPFWIGLVFWAIH